MNPLAAHVKVMMHQDAVCTACHSSQPTRLGPCSSQHDSQFTTQEMTHRHLASVCVASSYTKHVSPPQRPQPIATRSHPLTFAACHFDSLSQLSLNTDISRDKSVFRVHPMVKRSVSSSTLYSSLWHRGPLLAVGICTVSELDTCALQVCFQRGGSAGSSESNQPALQHHLFCHAWITCT